MPKVIIISGGSDGLGKAIAQKLSPTHQVIILSHNQEKLETVAKEINCDYGVADVADYGSLTSAVNQIISKYKQIDVLINCAGVWIGGPLSENDPQKIEEVIKVNSLGTIFLTKAVLPSMLAINSGQILNIISQDGITCKKDRSVYHASKWAVTGFTKCLQEDLLDTHVRVTGIYPGLMKTNLFQKNGVERDLSNALDLDSVAGLVEYAINLSENVSIPEIGIVPISNSKQKMDDNNSPVGGLDMNPDMMTTSSTIPLVGTPLPQKTQSGIIDITPGASTDQFVSPITYPPVATAVPVMSSEPVASIETIPPQPETTQDLLSVLPQAEPITEVTDASVVVTPDTPLSMIATEVPPLPVVETNPLYEDPDLVKLIK